MLNCIGQQEVEDAKLIHIHLCNEKEMDEIWVINVFP